MALETMEGARLPGTIQVPRESSEFEAVPDGAGYLLFAGVGGLYDARPDGIHRITTGALLAVGPTGWLVLECDEVHRCHPVLIGRLDGSRRVVNATVSRLGYGVISPDGSTAAMLTQNPDGGLAVYLLDLASGRRRDLGLPVNQESTDGSSFLFSPDGRWLFAVKPDGTLAVANCRTGAVDAMNVPLPPLSQLVIRPAR
jgi:hypothetical protein